MMLTVTADGKLRRWARLARYLSHFNGELWVLYATLQLMTVVLPPSDVVVWIMLTALAVLVIVAFALGGTVIHKNHPWCGFCNEHLPIDGKKALRPRRLALWAYHSRRRWLLWIGASVVLFIPVCMFLLPKPWSFAYIITTAVWVYTTWWMVKWHERLRPWCKYCQARVAKLEIIDVQ